MKKVFGIIAVLFLVFAFSGCEEKSSAEKAKESVKDAWSDTKDAVKEATN